MTPGEITFNKLNEIVANATTSPNGTNSRDLVDFIMTVGDNIYPRDSANPTDEEFDTMLSLF